MRGWKAVFTIQTYKCKTQVLERTFTEMNQYFYSSLSSVCLPLVLLLSMRLWRAEQGSVSQSDANAAVWMRYTSSAMINTSFKSKVFDCLLFSWRLEEILLFLAHFGFSFRLLPLQLLKNTRWLLLCGKLNGWPFNKYQRYLDWPTIQPTGSWRRTSGSSKSLRVNLCAILERIVACDEM